MKNLNLKEETLAKECEDYSNLWNDSSSWVTASGTKVNNKQTTYKDKLQKLVDFHIADTLAHDAKARGRWKPTANMNIKALDETADSAFLTFTETCYRGQAGIAEKRMIDAFYSKQTKKFKILFFLNKKLIIRKEGASFNDMMEELCFFFRSPKFGTPERQDLMEWVDKNGTRINLNNTTSPTNKSAASKSTSTTSGSVYAWSVYVRGSTCYPKGGWLSAEYFNGHLEGAVFSTPELAEGYAWDHLKELEDEGELYDEDEDVELDADYFTIETIAYPKADMNANVDLIEFVDKSGQKVVLNSNSAAPRAPKATASNTNPVSSTASATPASQPPVVAKNVMKRKPAKDKFGLLIPNWQPEFIKLGLEIWNTTKKPADEKDSGAGPSILRIYFEMPNGEEWRLEVTNTKYSLAKGLGLNVDEDWDYVISTDRNGNEIIIQRGKTKDYNEFLDILLGLGIISNKKKCV
jgi:hypothetical protein